MLSAAILSHAVNRLGILSAKRPHHPDPGEPDRSGVMCSLSEGIARDPPFFDVLLGFGKLADVIGSFSEGCCNGAVRQIDRLGKLDIPWHTQLHVKHVYSHAEWDSFLLFLGRAIFDARTSPPVTVLKDRGTITFVQDDLSRWFAIVLRTY